MAHDPDPRAARPRTLEAIWRDGPACHARPSARAAVDAAALVATAAQGDAPVYGVNTGFGKLASVRIAPEDTETLQRNLILSHCCGVGEALEPATVRLMMALKLLSLGRGASGVRWEICARSRRCWPQDVTSGDPGAGLGRGVGRSGAAGAYGRGDDRRGRGDVWGQRMPGGQALRGRADAGRAWPQGGARADQRHAVFDRLRADGAVRRPARGRRRAWSPRRCPPTRSWARPRRCTRPSTPCAAIPARSTWRARWPVC